MKSSRTSRFLLSMFAVALMMFGWTGASRAQLYVANGTDAEGHPVTIDINVNITFEVGDTGPYDQIQFTIMNMSSLMADGMSDIIASYNVPVTDTSSIGTGPFADWTSTLVNPDTIMLNSTGTTDMLAPGATASLTLFNSVGTEIKGPISVSTGSGSPPNEIFAYLVPEPSSIVLASFGVLGFLGYSLRRQLAK
jgi:hypothetical protein